MKKTLVIMAALLFAAGVTSFAQESQNPEYGYKVSNFISNSATAALLIPILIVVANGMADPEAANNAQFLALGGTQAMIVFIAMCASIAMLFPISTPPNAIASATGMVETKDMTRVGLIIGVVGFVFGYFWLTKIFPFA